MQSKNQICRPARGGFERVIMKLLHFLNEDDKDNSDREYIVLTEETKPDAFTGYQREGFRLDSVSEVEVSAAAMLPTEIELGAA